MSVEEVGDKFNNWNPMENDFKNTKFNHYISGPGAELDEDLQPSQQAIQDSKGNTEMRSKPTLVFKNLPQGMTTNAVYNICSRHGAVKEVRDSSKNDYYFVELSTVADMESVFRALENNNYGFEVLVGKCQHRRPPLHREKQREQQNYTPAPPSSNEIDYENRKFQTSKRNHPRPKVKEDSILNANDAVGTGLPLNLIQNDAHSLERQGLYKMPKNNKFTYRNGRSYVNMPDKVKQFVDKKHKESSGTYNDSEEKFVHQGESSLMPNNVKKCSQCDYACDTVCERCSEYYCSVECQLSDWPDHRYVCGKPKHLQKTLPSKRKVQTENKSPNVSKGNNQKPSISATSKVIDLEGIPTEEVPRSTKISSQLLGNSSNSTKRLPASLKASLKQQSNSPKTPPEQPSTQQIQDSSKPAAKKLPAALRAASTQLQNRPKASPSPQQIPESCSKVSAEQVLNKPIASSEENKLMESSSKAFAEQHSRKPIANSEQMYKQNMPRSGNIVTIVSIIKTNLVFIRSITYDDNLSFLNTTDTLQSIGNKLRPLKTPPKSGEVVIAKFEDQFNRALVLRYIDPTKITVNLMDYGNTEHTSFKDLYEAPKEFVYKPRHAIPVLLKGVNDFYMTEEIRHFMHTYLNNIRVHIRYKPEDFVQGNDIYAVELIDETTEQNFNKMIIKLSKPVEPQNSNEICNRSYLKSIKLPVGNNVELFVMDNSLMLTGCISCTTKPYVIEIDKFKKEIQAYVASIPKEAYTPRVDELCVARYVEDDLWYRGVCIETVGDGYPSIHFIDYGNITTVPIDSIRRYPRQFTYPMCTFDCAIEGLPEYCDEEMVDKLEDLIPNGEIIECENVTVEEENNFYLLSLPNVLRELTKCGLIKND